MFSCLEDMVKEEECLFWEKRKQECFQEKGDTDYELWKIPEFKDVFTETPARRRIMCVKVKEHEQEF